MLVEQGANLNRLWLTVSKDVDHAAQGSARIHDVLHQKNVLTLQPCFRIVHQPHVPAGDYLGAIGSCDQKIDLQRAHDAADEVAHEDEAPLQQAKDEEVTLGIRVSNGRPKFPDAVLNFLGAVYYAPDLPALESRISC